MDTPRYTAFEVVLTMTILGGLTLLTDTTASAGEPSPVEALIGTYRLGPTISAAQAQSVISVLNKALLRCRDDYLAARIKYRIGVISFKAGIMDKSRSVFSELSNDANCPEPVRVCSLNMSAQIQRLAGENDKAFATFGQLAALLQRRMPVESNAFEDAPLEKLLCSALFSRAEICQQRPDRTAAIAEYERLLDTLDRCKDRKMSALYAPLAADRVCSLHLEQQDVNSYLRHAEVLVSRYARYYRTPLIKFEILCIRFLKSAGAAADFAGGSYRAPVNFIAYVKTARDTELGLRMLNELAELCDEYRNSYGGFLLRYHYAWLLEAVGQNDKAAETLLSLCLSPVEAGKEGLFISQVPVLIREYAKIQAAIILSEAANYRQALQVLGGLAEHDPKSHLDQLGKSVIKNIEILKTEDRSNENK